MKLLKGLENLLPGSSGKRRRSGRNWREPGPGQTIHRDYIEGRNSLIHLWFWDFLLNAGISDWRIFPRFYPSINPLLYMLIKFFIRCLLFSRNTFWLSIKLQYSLVVFGTGFFMNPEKSWKYLISPSSSMRSCRKKNSINPWKETNRS